MTRIVFLRPSEQDRASRFSRSQITDLDFCLAFPDYTDHNIVGVSGIDTFDQTANSQLKIVDNQVLEAAHLDCLNRTCSRTWTREALRVLAPVSPSVSQPRSNEPALLLI